MRLLAGAAIGGGALVLATITWAALSEPYARPHVDIFALVGVVAGAAVAYVTRDRSATSSVSVMREARVERPLAGTGRARRHPRLPHHHHGLRLPGALRPREVPSRGRRTRDGREVDDDPSHGPRPGALRTVERSDVRVHACGRDGSADPRGCRPRRARIRGRSRPRAVRPEGPSRHRVARAERGDVVLYAALAPLVVLAWIGVVLLWCRGRGVPRSAVVGFVLSLALPAMALGAELSRSLFESS
jgi:hypothetical protein